MELVSCFFFQSKLRRTRAHFSCDGFRCFSDRETADRICNFNRHYAEYAGYWQTTDFLKYVKENFKGEKGVCLLGLGCPVYLTQR